MFTPAFKSSPSSLVSIRTSTTVPFVPWGSLNDVSLTSLAFSPKIALNSFSSAGGSVSPFGVTFPTRISPGFTCAPILIIPYYKDTREEDIVIKMLEDYNPNLVIKTNLNELKIWETELKWK